MIGRRRIVLAGGESAILRSWRGDGWDRPLSDVTAFENRFAHRIGVKHALAVSSGREGMRLILEALDLKAGDEVLLPAYTLKDLVHLLRSMGLAPIPVEVDPDRFQMDPRAARRALTARTKVILATHLFGWPCDIRSLAKTAFENGLALVEDCAHSAGASIGRRSVGTFGVAGFFSFELTKPINTFGGGMVVTNRGDLARRIRDSIRTRPSPGPRFLFKVLSSLVEDKVVGSPLMRAAAHLFAHRATKTVVTKLYSGFHRTNRARSSRYLPVQARMGMLQLDRLDHRRRILQTMAEALRKRLPRHIRPQQPYPGSIWSGYFFVVRTPHDPFHVRRHLLRHGIDAAILDEVTDYTGSLCGPFDCVRARELYSSAVQIPCYPSLSPLDLDAIVQALQTL